VTFAQSAQRVKLIFLSTDSGGAHTKNIEVYIEKLLTGAEARNVTYMFSRLECNLGRIEPPVINVSELLTNGASSSPAAAGYIRAPSVR
jgi:hypothetical protein